MSEEDYQAMISKQGLHSFVVVLSTRTLDAIVRGDLWLRTIIGLLGGVAVAGLTLAWRTMVKSSELQIRLLRASELNNHLREMNVAAAWLAHETRNPLNIVRGLAQMISKQEEATAEIRRRSVEITTEVDRVTAQLNQFIAYSKPRDVKLSRVLLDGVVDEVARALGGDLEEKRARLSIQRSGLLVEADEQMLRQALFNLVMNAVQFVEPGGEVTVASGRAPDHDDASTRCRRHDPSGRFDRVGAAGAWPGSWGSIRDHADAATLEPHPYPRGSARRVSYAGCHSWAIPTTCGDLDGAVAMLHRLVSADAQAIDAAGGTMCAHSAALAAVVPTDERDARRLAITRATIDEAMITYPPHARFPEVEDAGWSAINSALRGETSPRAAVDAVQSMALRVLAD